ncbi:EAL domain-containing protein, partial [Rhizobium ruizarguesonis]
ALMMCSEARSELMRETKARSILTMCEGLEMEVVAEGIEDYAEEVKLRMLGCGMGQGYHFVRPADGIATLRFLHENYYDPTVM